MQERKITFEQWAYNPMGKGSSVISNREMYRAMYIDKLDKIMARELGKASYDLYMKDDVYYIHLKIYSEVVPGFTYDTVIQFYTDDPALKLARDLKKYNIKFYSNDPSFVYTFCYAYAQQGLIIKDLLPRMSKEALVKAATIRNPHGETGYVKSLYFAYLIIGRHNLYSKVKFETYGKKYNKAILLKNITHADEKIKSREIEGAKYSADKKKSKKSETELRKRESSTRQPYSMSNVLTPNRSSTASIATKVRVAKAAKSAKTAKRI